MTSVRNDEYVRDLVALSFSLLIGGGGAVKGVCGTYCKTGVQKRSFTRGERGRKKGEKGEAGEEAREGLTRQALSQWH